MFHSFPDRKVLKGAEEKNANELVTRFMGILKSFKESLHEIGLYHNPEINQFVNKVRCHIVLESKKSATFEQVFKDQVENLVNKFTEIAGIIKNFYDGIVKVITGYDSRRAKMNRRKLDSNFSSF